MKLLIFLSYLVPESEQIIWCRIYELKVAKNVEKMPFFGLEKFPKFPGFPLPNIREFPFPREWDSSGIWTPYCSFFNILQTSLDCSKMRPWSRNHRPCRLLEPIKRLAADPPNTLYLPIEMAIFYRFLPKLSPTIETILTIWAAGQARPLPPVLSLVPNCAQYLPAA